MRTGTMKLHAVGADVVLVERRIEGGADVFGESAENDSRVLAVNRCGEPRRAEYGGRVWEIPGESAIWITPDAESSEKPAKADWNGRD